MKVPVGAGDFGVGSVKSRERKISLKMLMVNRASTRRVIIILNTLLTSDRIITLKEVVEGSFQVRLCRIGTARDLRKRCIEI